MVRRWIYPLIGKSARKVPPMNKCCIIGDPVLTQKCQPINWSEDGLLLEQIVENLRAVLCSQTVKHPTWRIMLSRMTGRQLPLGFSVGMSANQIGVAKRVFALHLPREYTLATKGSGLNYGDPIPFSVFVNPRMTIVSKSKIQVSEGCLSVPHLSGTTTRFSHVRLEASDENGVEKSLDCKGMLSAAVQHEMDHLDGKLFLERLMSLNSLVHQSWALRRKGYLLHSEYEMISNS